MPLQIEILGTGPIVRPEPGEGCDYRIPGSIAEIREYLRPALQDRVPFGADWEATSLNTHLAKPVGWGVSIKAGTALYCPVGHLLDPQVNLPVNEILKIQQDCDAAGAPSLWYNVAYDHELSFQNFGWVPKHWHDVMHGVFLVDSNALELGLKVSSMRFLGLKMQELSELDQEWFRLSQKQRKLQMYKLPHQLPAEQVRPYGCADPDHTRQLWFHPKVQAAIREQPLVLRLEEWVSPVLREGNRHGVYLDRDRLVELKAEARAKIEQTKPQIFAHFGEEFALSRKSYLATKLRALVPDIQETTAGGDPTAAIKVLEKYKGHHPVVPLLIDYAKLEAQERNYTDKLIKAHDHFASCPWAQGRVRFSFSHIGVPTGRMKCGGGGKGLEAYTKGVADVNSQSIPEAEKAPGLPNLRSAFCAPPGFVVVAIDYSQIELRIPSNLSREPKWIQTFHDPDGDLHLTNAVAIAKVREPGVVVTKDDKTRRSLAKTTSFALLFGGDEHTVARNASIPIEAAKEIVDGFLVGLPYLRAWIEQVKKHAATQGQIATFMGRVRRLQQYFRPEPPRGDSGWKAWRKLKSRGEREAINHPVQGGAADIFKTACVLTRRAVESHGWDAAILSPQVLWIHDEVVWYVHEDWVTRVVPVLVKAMEFEVRNWPVPLKAEPEVGSRRLYIYSKRAKAQKGRDQALAGQKAAEAEAFEREIAEWDARLAALIGDDTGRNSTWGEPVPYEVWVRDYCARRGLAQPAAGGGTPHPAGHAAA